MVDEDALRERNTAMLPHLDERQRWLYAAAEAKAAGRGGIAAVARLTRIAASTIGRELKDLEAPETLPQGRVAGKLILPTYADRSLIGMLMSSTSETDALAGVTVLFEVGSWSPHHGCQG